MANRNPGVSSHNGTFQSAGSFHRLNITTDTGELKVCLCVCGGGYEASETNYVSEPSSCSCATTIHTLPDN